VDFNYIFLLQKFCDNVWTFIVAGVEFREVAEIGKVDRVKIVACDGQKSAQNVRFDQD